MMFAVVFVTACNRLGIYVKRKLPEDRSFSVSCFIFSVYALSCAGLYSAPTPLAGAFWQRVQLVTLGFFAPAILWFYYDYTGKGSVRRLAAYGVPSILLGLVNSLWTGPWTVSNDIPFVKQVSLPFGGQLVYNEMAMGILVDVQFVLHLAIMVHGALIMYQTRVENVGDRYRYLLRSYLIFGVTVISDMAIGAGWLSLPYTMEYGFFALIGFILVQNGMQLDRLGAVELAERRQEAHYSRYVNLSSDGICLIRFRHDIAIDRPVPEQVDAMLRYAYMAECNRALVDMYGLPGAVVILNQFISKWVQADSAQQRHVTELFIRSGYRLLNYETREKDVHGRRRYFINNIYGQVEGRHLVTVWAAKREITDMRFMLATIQDNEERYRNFVRNSTEGIWRFEFDAPIPLALPLPRLVACMLDEGRLVDANDTLAQMYHRPAPNLMSGMKLSDLMNGDESERNDVLSRLVTSGFRLKDVTFTNRDHLGKTRWFSCGISGVVQAGCLQSIWGAQRDITSDRVNAEALKASEAKYRNLLEHTGTLKAVIDGRMTIEYANNAFLVLAGRRREEVEQRMSLLDLMPEAERESVKSCFQRIRGLEHPGNHSCEMTFIAGDGHRVPVLATIGCIPDGNQWVVSMIDVSPIKNVERELRESKNILRLVLDTVPQSIFWKDRRSILRGCNAPFAHDFGLAVPEEIEGKTDYDIAALPAEAEHFRSDDRRVMDSGKPLLKITETHTLANGVVRYLETNKVPILDHQGHVTGLLGTYEDITERIRMLERLRKSEEDFRTLFTSMAEGMALHEIVVDGQNRPVDYVVLDVNPAYTRQTGIARDRAVGRHAREIYGDDGLTHLDVFAQVAATGVATTLEMQFHSIGRIFHASVYSPRRGRFAVIFTDITEARRLAELARENEERYRRVVETSQDGIFIFNEEDGIITFANEAFAGLFALAPASPSINRHWLGLAEEGSRPRMREYLAGVDASDSPSRPLSIAAIREDGSPFTAEILLSRMTVHGRPAVLGLIRDISERRRVEMELVTVSEREQQRLGREMHDTLGQLLAGLKFMVQGIAMRVQQGGACQDVADISGQVEHIASQCIYEARRIASGLFPHKLGHESLADSLRELSANMRTVLGCDCQYAGDDVACTLEPAMALHLYRIAQEATTNAVKHGQAGSIRIHLAVRGRSLILEIEDDGSGFDPAAVNRTGMGLRIMQHRAMLLDGALDITTREKGGTVVRCIAPLPASE